MRCVIAALIVMAACGKEGGGISASAPARAVDPNADLPIVTSDLALTVGKRTIGATIVEPQAPGRWPAMLLFAGSGPTDRDWNNPLLRTTNGSGKLLAEALAKHGMVVIRWDKAGSGKNPGPPLAEFSLDTYRDEAAAALDAVRARPDVRPDAIFVAGHSEGGIHATRLAALAGDRIRGVVFLSAAGRRMVDLMIEQLAGNFRDGAKMSPPEVDQQMRPIAQAFTDFIDGKAIDPKQVSSIPQVQQLITAITRPETANLARALFAFDPAAAAAKLPQRDFFVGGGGKDVQVDPAADGARLRDALVAAGKQVVYHVSPDMDHVLKHEPKSQAEIRANLMAAQANYNAAGRVLDDDFVTALVAWLAERSQP